MPVSWAGCSLAPATSTLGPPRSWLASGFVSSRARVVDQALYKCQNLFLPLCFWLLFFLSLLGSRKHSSLSEGSQKLSNDLGPCAQKTPKPDYWAKCSLCWLPLLCSYAFYILKKIWSKTCLYSECISKRLLEYELNVSNYNLAKDQSSDKCLDISMALKNYWHGEVFCQNWSPAKFLKVERLRFEGIMSSI